MDDEERIHKVNDYATVYLIPVFKSSGHWCNRCSLPSVTVFSIRGLSEFRDTPSVREIGELGVCEHCHNPSRRAAEFVDAVNQSHRKLAELYGWSDPPKSANS